MDKGSKGYEWLAAASQQCSLYHRANPHSNLPRAVCASASAALVISVAGDLRILV